MSRPIRARCSITSITKGADSPETLAPRVHQVVRVRGEHGVRPVLPGLQQLLQRMFQLGEISILGCVPGSGVVGARGGFACEGAKGHADGMLCRGSDGLFRAEHAPLLDEAIQGHPGAA